MRTVRPCACVCVFVIVCFFGLDCRIEQRDSSLRFACFVSRALPIDE